MSSQNTQSQKHFPIITADNKKYFLRNGNDTFVGYEKVVGQDGSECMTAAIDIKSTYSLLRMIPNRETPFLVDEIQAVTITSVFCKDSLGIREFTIDFQVGHAFNSGEPAFMGLHDCGGYGYIDIHVDQASGKVSASTQSRNRDFTIVGYKLSYETKTQDKVFEEFRTMEAVLKDKAGRGIVMVPIYQPLSNIDFAKHEGNIINQRVVAVDVLTRAEAVLTGALRVNKRINLRTVTQSDAFLTAGHLDVTDYIAAVILRDVWIVDSGKLKQIPINQELCLTDSERKLQGDFVDSRYGSFSIFVDLQTGELMTDTGAVNEVVGFEIAVIRGNHHHDNTRNDETPLERKTYSLKTYKENPQYQPGCIEIVVDSEADKAELLKAIEYLHDSRDIDTRFTMVNSFIHIYMNPDLIKVRAKC